MKELDQAQVYRLADAFIEKHRYWRADDELPLQPGHRNVIANVIIDTELVVRGSLKIEDFE